MTKEIAATAAKLNILLVKPQTQVCMGYMRSNRYGKEKQKYNIFSYSSTKLKDLKNRKHLIYVFINKLKVSSKC